MGIRDVDVPNFGGSANKTASRKRRYPTIWAPPLYAGEAALSYNAMRNIITIVAFLLIPFFGLVPFGVAEVSRGRIATTCVFLLNGMGHFLQSKPMAEMIPLGVPKPFRLLIDYDSGVFEIVAAVAALVPGWSRAVGILLCLFLVGVLPTNIDAAIRRVPFGGHGTGPRYLLLRVPLQIVLLCWIYWFEIRPPAE